MLKESGPEFRSLPLESLSQFLCRPQVGGCEQVCRVRSRHLSGNDSGRAKPMRRRALQVTYKRTATQILGADTEEGSRLKSGANTEVSHEKVEQGRSNLLKLRPGGF